MKRVLLSIMLMLSLMALPCFSPGVALAEEELIVSAAASLTNAFGEIGKKFETANPGVKVVFNFAASGPLLQQIDKGAPVDVFASADQKTMNQAAEKNLIVPETRNNFVSNELVLIIPKDAKVPLKSLQDLASKDVSKVALGNPETVPAGRYAKEALANENLWETLAPKFILGDSVRQVLDYVSRGEVDAGFVFSSDTVVAKDKVQVVAKAEKHQPILYPIAVVAAAQKKDLAGRFIAFVLADEGRKVLTEYGFGKP
jgi:molybdate transport system substrate-binding protein